MNPLETILKAAGLSDVCVKRVNVLAHGLPILINEVIRIDRSTHNFDEALLSVCEARGLALKQNVEEACPNGVSFVEQIDGPKFKEMPPVKSPIAQYQFEWQCRLFPNK